MITCLIVSLLCAVSSPAKPRAYEIGCRVTWIIYSDGSYTAYKDNCQYKPVTKHW